MEQAVNDVVSSSITTTTSTISNILCMFLDDSVGPSDEVFII